MSESSWHIKIPCFQQFKFAEKYVHQCTPFTAMVFNLSQVKASYYQNFHFLKKLQLS